MTPSATCVAFIKGYEKCFKRISPNLFKAYKPTPDDVWTVGWGSTGPYITQDTVWTQAQCDERFNITLRAFALKVSSMIGSVGATQSQFDAMCSLAYNIGIANFAKSSVLTNHRAAHYQTAAFAFGLWDKQRGSDGQLHVLNGLVKRRAAEAAMYRGISA